MADAATTKLIDSSGVIHDIPGGQASDEARRLGLVPATPEQVARFESYQKFQQPSEKLKATGVALARIPTLGFSDYGVEALAPGYLKEVEGQLPGLTGLTEVGGTIAAAMMTGGGSLLAGGARGALSATARGGLMREAMRGAHAVGEGGAALAKSLGAGARMQGLARHALREGAEGAAFGLMQGNKQVATDGDYERAASTIIRNVGVGAGAGAAFGTGLGIAGIGAKAVTKPLTRASAKAFASAKGLAPGPTQAFSDLVEPLFKYYEKATNKSADVGRKVVATDEALEVFLRRANEEGIELGDLLSRGVDDGLDAIKDVDKLTRAAESVSDIGKPQVAKALLESVEGTPAASEIIAKADVALSKEVLEEKLSRFGTWKWKEKREAKPSRAGGVLEGRLISRKRIFEPSDYALTVAPKEFWAPMADAITAAYDPNTLKRLIAEGHSPLSARAVALDRLKKSAFGGKQGKKIERFFKEAGAPGEGVRSLNAEFFQPLRTLLEDDAWGSFARWQTIHNRAWVERFGAKGFGKFKRQIGRDPGTDSWTYLERAHGGKIDALVQAIGSRAGDIDAEIIRQKMVGWKMTSDAAEYLRKQPSSAKVIPAKTFKNAKRLGDAADRVLKALDDQDGKSLYSKIYATRQFEELLKNQKRFLGGIPGQLAIGLGIATGSPVVYGGLRTMQAVGDIAMSPVKAVDTLGSVYLSAKKLKDADTRFVGKIFSKAKRIPGVVAKRTRKVGRGIDAGANYALANLTASQVLYEENVGELNAALEDLDAADEKMHDSLNAIMPVASDLKAVAFAKKRVIREYLATLISTPSVSPTLIGRIRPPSKVEAQRFNRVKHILENPGDASKLLADGKLTSDQAKALRTIWPSIFSELQELAMEEMVKLGEDGKTVSYQRRLQLGILLGLPTDPTLNYRMFQDIQRGYREKVQAPQPPQQRRAPKLNRAIMSESEKTEEGVK